MFNIRDIYYNYPGPYDLHDVNVDRISASAVSVYEVVNTWTSSPELLWESLHQHFIISFEKNYHQRHTKTQKYSLQPAKIKDQFNVT